ncbi:MAG: DUF1998 domain-containing protein [Chloroflexi bacterium]|nr:DUF1998 domain-containing protein [Chloroflexota bacterium]
MVVENRRRKVGEIRPSQMLFAFGVGAIVDLPNLSTMVMGLDDWDIANSREIVEERLLAAVREDLGPQVERLLSPPAAIDAPNSYFQPLDPSANIGIPVATFPRWVVCPSCRLLAPLNSGLFQLKADQFRPDRTRYVHSNCNKARTAPTVVPARFLVACEKGHLDDFPWLSFVHQGNKKCPARLRLRELGVSGEAADVQVECEVCGDNRRMSDAFGEEGKTALPHCRGRRPHLRDFEDDGCTEPMKAILLGASNSWFPLVFSALSVPLTTNKLALLVDENWPTLTHVTSSSEIDLLRRLGQLRAFAEFSTDDIWAAVEAKKNATVTDEQAGGDLKSPEWEVFVNPDPMRNTTDFRLRQIDPPREFANVVEKVVIAERLREVRALVGFTRIESPGDFDEVFEVPADHRAPLSRRPPRWLPAVEVRGEGIFIQFKEDAVTDWLNKGKAIDQRRQDFLEANRRWRQMRGFDVLDAGFPGMRFVLLHSFSHAIIRQLALESGYAVASIRERIYSLPAEADKGPMAGILLYTAAPDSEGTLGGLASLGEPAELGRHIGQALEQVRLCASDPLCAEHHPYRDGTTLHGAACHACLFVPETSCERGNKFLDRSTLVSTIEGNCIPFFPTED